MSRILVDSSAVAPAFTATTFEALPVIVGSLSKAVSSKASSARIAAEERLEFVAGVPLGVYQSVLATEFYSPNKVH